MLWPCTHAALHFVRRSSVLSIHFIDLDRFQIDPIDGARIDRQSPSHKPIHNAFEVLKLVHDWDTTRRTESVPAYVAPESVDGEMIFASELDVFFRWVNPEIGVLFMMFRD